MTRGFTLLEIIFVLAAAAILLSVGLPSFQSTVRNFRLTASVNDLVGAMQLARSEAIKRRVPVVLCTSGGGEVCDGAASWHEGWIVWADEDNSGARAENEPLLQRRDSMRRGVSVSTPDGQQMQDRLTYAPSGFPDVGGLDAAGIMVFCDEQQSDNFGRVIIVAQTGRPVARHIDSHDFGVTCE